METSKLRKRSPASTMFDPAIVLPSLGQAFVKLDPRTLAKNPVMFVLEIVTLLTTVILARDTAAGGQNVAFELQIVIWLWFTVLFANFAEAVAEGRGKAQADTLRKTRTETRAKRILMPDNTEVYEGVFAENLQAGDIVVCEPGDLIPGDGEVIEGIASVNEAAITGESAPVIRESGGDRSAVTGGTTVLSDRIIVRITSSPGSSFLDRMIKLVEGAERQKTPNEIALNILLVGLTIIFVFATATIPSYVAYASGAISVVVLVALFVTLIPTTIGALLSAIGIAGMDRLVRFNVLAMSGRAVEAAGDVDTLLLDKTGTVTFGNRLATEIVVVPGGPVRVITLTAAGGLLDIMARTLAQSLSESMGQQFYVENKVGAGGNLGVSELARSAPDGYTIGMSTVSTHGINPSLYGSKLPFDALNDFEFLAIAAELKNVVVVNPKVPAKSMQELVRYAKDNPGKINFGSAGVGTSQHMAGELFKYLAKIDINHVAYKGAAQAAPDLVSGEIQLMFSSIPDMLGFIQADKLHAIGITTKNRSPVLPDVVPVAEQGFPDFDVKAWFGLAAPKGTPPDIVAALNKQINAALAKSDVKDRLAKMGMDTAEPVTPA